VSEQSMEWKAQIKGTGSSYNFGSYTYSSTVSSSQL